jgi:hypothetical protein
LIPYKRNIDGILLVVARIIDSILLVVASEETQVLSTSPELSDFKPKDPWAIILRPIQLS